MNDRSNLESGTNLLVILVAIIYNLILWVPAVSIDVEPFLMVDFYGAVFNQTPISYISVFLEDAAFLIIGGLIITVSCVLYSWLAVSLFSKKRKEKAKRNHSRVSLIANICGIGGLLLFYGILFGAIPPQYDALAAILPSFGIYGLIIALILGLVDLIVSIKLKKE